MSACKSSMLLHRKSIKMLDIQYTSLSINKTILTVKPHWY